MTGRIRLDDLTTGDLENLYDRLDATEKAIREAHRLAAAWDTLGTYGSAPHLLRAALAPAGKPRPAAPSNTGRQIRALLPVLRAALDTLPKVCRWHGDRLDPDGPAWGTGEACCDTGIPARRRRQAQTAVDALALLAQQPARIDIDRAALLPRLTSAVSQWRTAGDAAAAEAVLDVLTNPEG